MIYLLYHLLISIILIIKTIIRTAVLQQDSCCTDKNKCHCGNKGQPTNDFLHNGCIAIHQNNNCSFCNSQEYQTSQRSRIEYQHKRNNNNTEYIIQMCCQN